MAKYSAEYDYNIDTSKNIHWLNIGFNENDYAVVSNANIRSWESLSAEFVAVRRSTLFLFNSFSASMLNSKGTANNNTFSVKELGFIIIGHFSHHKKIMEERYF